MMDHPSNRSRAGAFGPFRPIMQGEVLITDLARSPWTPVLVEGRTPRDIARRIHQATYPDRRAPFIEVDCTWLPPNEAGQLLFGSETGLRRVRRGCIERANGGTLFLEDIADLANIIQARLAKLLDAMRFRRDGGATDVEVAVRIVASVRGRIETALGSGHLRRDLHSRLNVFPIGSGDVGPK